MAAAIRPEASIHQWLDAIAVASRNHVPRTFTAIINDKCKFTPKMSEESRGAVDLVERQNQLAVAVALENVTVNRFALSANGIIVIYFAVYHGMYLVVASMKRLSPRGGQVIDGKSTMSQPYLLVVTDPNVRVIRATVGDDINRGFELRHVASLLAVPLNWESNLVSALEGALP
ncbi:Major facilitator superfamily domain general substrate transporter [Penicillium mononematosum]|uniref:Major facilitator superfamily domain general substrate transporter n=1 Tax=Penicillium mononematosum TaxID=268346 RepID=UPI00254945D1|nr:Major facilitator superfamily domain general substrate transporter [Penicillium mononematosum]KAJ6180513.1 Major facilitator superfamily domain general substrate transporter [Penicillium mononematosum]